MKKLSKEELSHRTSRPIGQRPPMEVKDPKIRPGAEKPRPNRDPDDKTEHERDNRSVKGKKGMSHP
jgi:hypothetical protein